MDKHDPTTYGAIILCGGESSRMGRDKASLPWGPHTTMLEHVVGILQEVVPTNNILVVAGQRQQVPPLACGGNVVHEQSEGAGPLLALIEGLCHLPAGVPMAFACGCDTPLLKPAFVRRLFALFEDKCDIVVPADAERLYPLAAVYATESLPKLRNAVEAGERSLHRAIRGGYADVREVDLEELRAVDPKLDSLVNCNTCEDYEAAIARSLES